MKMTIQNDVTKVRENKEKEVKSEKRGYKTSWNIFVLLTLVFCMSFVVSCGQNVEKESKTSEPETSSQMGEVNPSNSKTAHQMTYSNLVDVASQEEVKKALLDAGISPAAVEEFFVNVNEFNSLVENKSLNVEGFRTIDTQSPEYDLVFLQQILEEKSPDFIGYNCRLTTYGLMKEFIKVGTPSMEEPTNLFLDLDAIQNKPGMMTEAEVEIFKNIFGRILTEKGAELAPHLNKVKEDYANKDIQFESNDKASLVAVYFGFDDGVDPPELFIGHIGVLVRDAGGKLLFIEKLSFQEPYQAIKFNNRVELNDYLMRKYDVEWGQENVRPFIMENGELMEGYRILPKEETNSNSM